MYFLGLIIKISYYSYFYSLGDPFSHSHDVSHYPINPNILMYDVESIIMWPLNICINSDSIFLCHHHHHHHHPANMQLGHLLTHSGLTFLDVSLMVSPCFFLPFGLQFFIIPSNILRGVLFICWNHSYNKSQWDAPFLKFILPNFKIPGWQIPIAVYTVLRLLMMDSSSVWNMLSSSPK